MLAQSVLQYIQFPFLVKANNSIVWAILSHPRCDSLKWLWRQAFKGVSLRVALGAAEVVRQGIVAEVDVSLQGMRGHCCCLRVGGWRQQLSCCRKSSLRFWQGIHQEHPWLSWPCLPCHHQQWRLGKAVNASGWSSRQMLEDEPVANFSQPSEARQISESD